MAIDDYGAASEWDADFASLASRFRQAGPPVLSRCLQRLMLIITRQTKQEEYE